MTTRACLSAIAAVAGAATSASALTFQEVGTHRVIHDEVFDGGAAEIVTYSKSAQKLFVVNGLTDAIDVLDLSDVANFGQGSYLTSLNLGGFSSPNSVAAWESGLGNYIAVASDLTIAPQGPGNVQIFDLAGTLKAQVNVGSIPDMLTFAEVGGRLKIVVANEGEPNDAWTLDPEGSIALVDVLDAVTAYAAADAGDEIADATVAGVKTIRFNAFEAQKAALQAAGLRIYGPTGFETLAQNLEPEYIAVDGEIAWVSLQENNAIAKIDLATETVLAIKPLGFKDHSLPGNGLDPSDRDGDRSPTPDTADDINIANWPVFGMYQPDGITTVKFGGSTFLLSANEGDARDYAAYSEEERVEDLILDPTAFPDAADLQKKANLGRLTVTSATGDTDGDGDFDELYALGARSFSLWDADGNLVWDSGDFLEQKIAQLNPENFNSNNDENDSYESRSDNKGPEPETVITGEAFGRLLVFVGLERQSGVMVFDFSDFDPNDPNSFDLDAAFMAYLTNRDFSVADVEADLASAGDLGPEGLLFISAADSANGAPLLVVANEISGTTTVWQIVPEPASLALMSLGVLTMLRRRR